MRHPARAARNGIRNCAAHGESWYRNFPLPGSRIPWFGSDVRFRPAAASRPGPIEVPA